MRPRAQPLGRVQHEKSGCPSPTTAPVVVVTRASSTLGNSTPPRSLLAGRNAASDAGRRGIDAWDRRCREPIAEMTLAR